jgi:hypothetical protein
VKFSITVTSAVLLVPLAVSCEHPSHSARDALDSPAVGTAAPSVARSSLTPDEVLQWRTRYGDLLGKPPEAAIERYGAADEQKEDGYAWHPSDKTDNREVSVRFLSADEKRRMVVIKVYARKAETLDPVELLKRSPLLDFKTGAYTDSLTHYFIAMTKDGRNSFQFDVHQDAINFRAAVFADKARK